MQTPNKLLNLAESPLIGHLSPDCRANHGRHAHVHVFKTEQSSTNEKPENQPLLAGHRTSLFESLRWQGVGFEARKLFIEGRRNLGCVVSQKVRATCLTADSDERNTDFVSLPYSKIPTYNGK